MPERVWEQSLVSALAEAGVEYTVLDDFHFQRDGLEESDLLGYYLTEDDGRLVMIFPGSERLRYTMPFQEPHATYEYLRRLAEQHPGATVVFADDGEKFGSWPKTFDHVYTHGWLRRFCDMIVGNRDVARADHLRRRRRFDGPARQDLPARLLVPRNDRVGPAAPRLAAYKEAVRQAAENPAAEGLKPFVRGGGFWRNFKATVSRERRDVHAHARDLESPGGRRGQPRHRPRLPRGGASGALPGPVQLRLLARCLRRSLSATPSQRDLSPPDRRATRRWTTPRGRPAPAFRSTWPISTSMRARRSGWKTTG